jgi:hypothetical protein
MSVLFLLTGGCAAPIRYEPGGPACVVKAPQNGQYNLYREGGDAPVWNAILLKGDAIGYERDRGDQLVAVADVQRRRLAEHEYRWQHVELAQPAQFNFKPLLAAAPVVIAGAVKFAAVAVIYAPLYALPALARASRHWGPGGGHHR